MRRRDPRASVIVSAANQPPSDNDMAVRVALLESRLALLTKALLAKSFDMTLSFLHRQFDTQLSSAGNTQREKRLVLEKLAHGNCFAFIKPDGEYRIVEADCLEDAWRKVRLMEGWAGPDIACFGSTAPGVRDYAA